MLRPRRRSVMIAMACLMMVGMTLQPQDGQAIERSNQDSGDFDTIIENGTIIDGSGKEKYDADVGIRDGYIARIGDLQDESADNRLDAQGQFVIPGFIDPHTHATSSAAQKAKSALTQGVTTEFVNSDGFGTTDLQDIFDWEKDGLGINIAPYIGFNATWSEVVGEDDRDATSEEIEKMRSLVTKGLEDGAFGISSGLFYTPANYADTEEVIDVVSAAKDWRTNFPTHIRNENNDVIDATKEVIEIGEKTGLVPIVDHMKTMGPDNWGKSEETVHQIQEANENGDFTGACVYPYLRSSTGLTAIVPQWVQDGGTEKMLERFADSELRPQIEEEIEETMHSRVEGPEDVYFPSKQKTLADYMKEKTFETPTSDYENDDGEELSPGEATMRILEQEGGSLSSIYRFGKEDDLKRIMQNSTTGICSDGGASTSNSTHPRHYGTFTRVLGKYVREEGYLDWEEAIQKMTALTAARVGMVDRGLLAEGMKADIAVFDPDTVIDKATFDHPKQYSEGVKHVLVNGEIALRDGELTNKQAGKVLKRKENMPSRPMSLDKDFQSDKQGQFIPLDLDNSNAKIEMEYSLSQNADDRNAEGNFSIHDQEDEIDLETLRLGNIQFMNEWTGFTGRATWNGEERNIQVTIDENDPVVDGQLPVVTLQIEGVDEIKGMMVSQDSINTTKMKTQIKQFEEDEEFENAQSAHALNIHLTAINRYEKKEDAEKVVKHLNGLKELLQHQKEEELISEKANMVLQTEADVLIAKWE